MKILALTKIYSYVIKFDFNLWLIMEILSQTYGFSYDFWETSLHIISQLFIWVVCFHSVLSISVHKSSMKSSQTKPYQWMDIRDSKEVPFLAQKILVIHEYKRV